MIKKTKVKDYFSFLIHQVARLLTIELVLFARAAGNNNNSPTEEETEEL